MKQPIFSLCQNCPSESGCRAYGCRLFSSDARRASERDQNFVDQCLQDAGLGRVTKGK